jgi:hypothetical protein
MDTLPADASLVIDRNIVVAMRDGVELRADVFRPAAGRWPALVQRTPYGRSPYPDTSIALNPVLAAESGYAVVIEDVRGRGNSQGEFHPFTEREDGYDTVEWTARQDWCDGRVGLFGSSYMGATAIQGAVAAPPSLVTFVAAQASSRYDEGRSYWGGALELAALLGSSLGAMAAGALEHRRRQGLPTSGMRSAIKDLLERQADRPVPFPLMSVFGRQDSPLRELTPWFFEWLEHATGDPYWSDLAVGPRHAEVATPGLHITSWYDQFHVGAIDNFVGLRAEAATDAARGSQHLIVGPWLHYALRGHSVGASRVGDISFGSRAALNLDAIQLQWFNEWIKGEPARRPRSPIRLFVMGTNVWRDEAAWPLERADERSWYLAGSGSAATDPSSGSLHANTPRSAGVDRFDYDPANPVPTLGGAHLAMSIVAPAGQIDQARIESRPDVLSYTSDHLERAIEVTGPVRAEIWFSTSAVSTDLTARLVDVHPDGAAYSVCDGIRRLAPDADHDAGAAHPVLIEMGATSQVFLPGHRLRVDVSSSNYPRFDPNPNTGESSLQCSLPIVAHQVVHFGPDQPSRILLPVISEPR